MCHDLTYNCMGTWTVALPLCTMRSELKSASWPTQVPCMAIVNPTCILQCTHSSRHFLCKICLHVASEILTSTLKSKSIRFSVVSTHSPTFISACRCTYTSSVVLYGHRVRLSAHACHYAQSVILCCMCNIMPELTNMIVGDIHAHMHIQNWSH